MACSSWFASQDSCKRKTTPGLFKWLTPRREDKKLNFFHPQFLMEIHVFQTLGVTCPPAAFRQARREKPCQPSPSNNSFLVGWVPEQGARGGSNHVENQHRNAVRGLWNGTTMIVGSTSNEPMWADAGIVHLVLRRNPTRGARQIPPEDSV